MLAISQTIASDAVAVNVLPCRINHTGPTKVKKRFWQPQSSADGTKIAYFRGRKLHGRCVKLPEKYQGLVLKQSDKVVVDLPPPLIDEEDDEEPELPQPVKVVDQVATFEEVTVWGHDQLPAADDAMVKGTEEWISFAEAIHGRI